MKYEVQDTNRPPYLMVPHLAVRSPELRPIAKLVLFALMSHADNRLGSTYVSHGKLAQELASSTPTIQRVILELVEGGWLETQERPGSSTIYTLDSVAITDRLTATYIKMIGVLHQNDRTTSIKMIDREEPIKKPVLITKGSELLECLSEDERAVIDDKFSDLDIEWEASKCVSWHLEKGRKMKLPKAAFNNWLSNATPNFNRNGAPTNGTSEEPVFRARGVRN